MSNFPLRAAVLLVGLMAAASAQTTWTVDDDGGSDVDFASLPAAVAAAVSGDTIVVGPGSYAPFHVTGKALTLRGAGSGQTFVDLPPSFRVPDGPASYVRIADVPAGGVFRFEGVAIRTPATVVPVAVGNPGFDVRLHLVGAASRIVLIDVRSEPTASALAAPGNVVGAHGLVVEGAHVQAFRSAFTGAPSRYSPLFGLYWTQYGGAGVRVLNGRIFADDCAFTGADADGSPVFWSLPLATQPTGGPGLFASFSVVALHRCRAQGGAATVFGTWGANASSVATGGIGVDCELAQRTTVTGDSAAFCRGGGASRVASVVTLVPGAALRSLGGFPVRIYGEPTLQPGSHATPALTPIGQFVLGLPPLPELDIDGLLLEPGLLAATHPTTLTISQGTPFAPFLVALHVVPDVVGDPLPGVFEGTSLLAGGGFPWFADTLDANGAYATTFVPATLFPALVGSPVHLQAATYDPTLQRWLLSNAEVRTPLY
jgi:hypothetical protein